MRKYDPLLARYWPAIGPLLARYWPAIGPLLARYWPTLSYEQPINSFLTF